MLRALVIVSLGTSPVFAACARTGVAPASPNQVGRGDCQGHVFGLPREPFQIRGAAGVQGYAELSTMLLPDGRLTDETGWVGRLDESGCFHDTSGALVARWGNDGRLLEAAAHGPQQLRLSQGRLELFVEGRLETTWTIDGARILRNGAPVASITTPGDPAAAAMALRILILPDIARTARARPLE